MTIHYLALMTQFINFQDQNGSPLLILPVEYPLARSKVEVDLVDRDKTAFTTPFSLHQFCVMPFGLCNLPGTFQRLMETTLMGLHRNVCLVYLDDIIIFSQTIEEHLIRLKQILQCLRMEN